MRLQGIVASVLGILHGGAFVRGSMINLNEVSLTPLSEFLYGHLGVCGAAVNSKTLDTEDWAPWTTKPQCLTRKSEVDNENKTFCIFSKKDFAEGRGIVFITTPEVAADVAKKPAFAKPETILGMNDLVNPPWGPPPYEKIRIPLRGFGMIANRTIFRGERIMQETPSYIYNRDIFGVFEDEDRVPWQWNAAYQLPEETRVELMALHKQHGGDEIDDLMRTNAFGAYYGDPYVLHNNVLPRISVSLSLDFIVTATDCGNFFVVAVQPRLQTKVCQQLKPKSPFFFYPGSFAEPNPAPITTLIPIQ